MRGWAYLLAGLILWAIHFFALYAIASVFLTTNLARALTLVVTLICLVAAAVLARRMRRQSPANASGSWTRSVALGGLGIAAVAIAWQGLPALLI